MFPKIGDVVGDYCVVGTLGSGGMGAVYRVEHVITKRIEAMKLLASDLAIDSKQEQRFVREIQVQARLHHPNIAAVYNAFRAGRHFAMVMELVEGDSLQTLLERGPIPLPAGVEYTRQVLSALEYAHAEGVVHRDVTPANMIITTGGIAKLTDFGLALAATDLRLTRSGAPVGSVWYMSPEQVTASSAIDLRTDIYSVGAVLYEILTGHKLFDLDTAFAVMQSHVGLLPMLPSQRNREVPPSLDDIVLKALQKEPDARFQSAGEFRLALERADLTKAPAVQPKQKAPRRRVSRAASAVILTMAALGAAFGGLRLFPGAAGRQIAKQNRQQLPSPSIHAVSAPPDAESTAVPPPGPGLPAVVDPPEGRPPYLTEPATPQFAARPARRVNQPRATSQIRVTGGEVDRAEDRPPASSLRAQPEPPALPVETMPRQATPSESTEKPLSLAVTESSPSPPAAGNASTSSKPRKTGNRFLRLLGKIVPSKTPAAKQ